MRLPLLLSIMFALPSFAAVVDCDSLTVTQRRQAETIGACISSAPKSLCLPATDAGLSALVDLLSEQANYQETVPCGQTRIVDDLGVVLVAGIGDTQCTSANIGDTVVNPQNKRQVALMWLRLEINQRVQERQLRSTLQSERDRLESTTVVVPEVPEVQ